MPLEPQRSGGASDGQKSADGGKMPPPGSSRVDAESIGHLSQSGHLVMGPGARRDTATGTIFSEIISNFSLIFFLNRQIWLILCFELL